MKKSTAITVLAVSLGLGACATTAPKLTNAQIAQRDKTQQDLTKQYLNVNNRINALKDKESSMGSITKQDFDATLADLHQKDKDVETSIGTLEQRDVQSYEQAKTEAQMKLTNLNNDVALAEAKYK